MMVSIAIAMRSGSMGVVALMMVDSRCSSVGDGLGGDKWSLWDGDVSDGVLDDGGVDVVGGLEHGSEVLGSGGGEVGPESVLVGDVVVGQDAAVGERVSAEEIMKKKFNRSFFFIQLTFGHFCCFC